MDRQLCASHRLFRHPLGIQVNMDNALRQRTFIIAFNTLESASNRLSQKKGLPISKWNRSQYQISGHICLIATKSFVDSIEFTEKNLVLSFSTLALVFLGERSRKYAKYHPCICIISLLFVPSWDNYSLILILLYNWSRQIRQWAELSWARLAMIAVRAWNLMLEILVACGLVAYEMFLRALEGSFCMLYAESLFY